MPDKKMGPKEILSGGGEKKKGPEKKKTKHKETRIEHHPDGSHTVRHIPVSDGTSPPGPEVSYAAKDLDGVHDGLEEHLGEPNGSEGTPPAATPPQEA
jgi:hypothetical protein